MIESYASEQMVGVIPLKVSINPPNETHAALGQQIVVTFSEPMDIATIAPAITVTGFVLFPQNVPVNVGSLDGKHFLLTPKNGGVMSWTPNALYVVKIDKTATSKAFKKHLSSPFVSNFYLAEHPCVDPEFTFNFNYQCTYHPCDEDDEGVFEGDYDTGCQEGEPFITGEKYTATWNAKNVTYVMDDCHGYHQETDFDEDSGKIKWGWDMDDNNFPGFFGQPPELDKDKKVVMFHCSATAYGACGKMITVPYTYSCP